MIVGDTEEDESLRGTELRVEISIDRVSTRELPPLDDALAQTVGPYLVLAELRARITGQLFEFKHTQAHRTYADRAVEAFTNLSTITLPPKYMEDRMAEALAELKERVKRDDKIEFSDWLKLNGHVEETMREEMRKTVEPQARTNLVLGGVRHAENVVVTEPELKKALTRQIELAKTSGVDLKKVSQQESYRLNLAGRLLTEKVVERMVEIARGRVIEESNAGAEDMMPAIVDPSA